MANEDKKDFNAMLHDSKDMPKMQTITAGIFVSIAAWASYQRTTNETPYWRTLKAKGELNPKYPGGVEAQKEKLEQEGHTVIQKGRTNIRYYVKDYEQHLYELELVSFYPAFCIPDCFGIGFLFQ